MRTLVLSINFLVLAASPFTCSTEMSRLTEEPQAVITVEATATATVATEIDPIVMPKKP